MGWKFERFTINSALNFFISTYTLVFITQISSFICACASLSSNFTVALHSSQAFFFLQRLTICFTSLSLGKPHTFHALYYQLFSDLNLVTVYVLLVESSTFSSKSLSPDVTFEKVHDVDTEKGHPNIIKEEIAPRRPNRPSEVEVQDIGRFDLSTYNTSEHVSSGRIVFQCSRERFLT